MAFDIFLQSFAEGQPQEIDLASVRRVFSANGATLNEANHRVSVIDGGCDIFGLGGSSSDGLMVNHVDGEQIWGVIYEIAVDQCLTIMPVGCPVVVTADESLEDLPIDLGSGIVVQSGADLRRVVEGES